MSTVKYQTIQLPENLIIEIEAVRSENSIEGFVYQAIEAHAATIRERQLQDQLAADYDELALIYYQLAGELADEVWLPVENEALTVAEIEAAS